MRPKAFADDDVLQAVAVEIGEGEGVWLSEGHAVFRLLGSVAHEDVFLKADTAVIVHLLEPRQAPAVGVERSNDVVASVAIDIVGEHLRTTFFSELELVPD